MQKNKKYPIETEDLWEIIENLHDEIMVYDDAYHLVFVNKAAERHYGKKSEELIGTHFSKLDETYWGNSTLPEVYEKKKMVVKRQITNLGLDIITISVPIFDKEGNIKYVAQNVNDIYNYNKIGKAEEAFLEITNASETPEERFLYTSENMKGVMETIEKIKNVKNPCLLLGETGTGKTFLAKYMHQQSIRKHMPFVAVNCACMNPNLIESELFGYKKGAFSGANTAGKKGIVEIADGGTLFLDEISEIPYDLQGKLLHFIQDQEFLALGSEKKQKVDVKIIAATNRNLADMVKAKTFREDLYYRLNIFEISIPPLRERKKDVEILIQYYLNKYNEQHFRNHTLSVDAMEILINYKWPGNVRELSHVMEKVVVLTNGKEIQSENLPKMIFDLDENKYTDKYDRPSENKTLREALEDVERKMVQETYQKYQNSVKVAQILGVSQPTAYRLIKKYIIL